MMTMEMYFYNTPNVVFLLKSWTIQDNNGLYFCALALSFVLAVLVEFLKSVIDRIENDFVHSIVYFSNLFLAYILMLILMTFNAGLFIVICAGYTFGYFLFGFREVKFHAKGNVGGINLSSNLQQNILV